MATATPVLTYFQRRMSPSFLPCDSDSSCSTSWEFCSAPCSTDVCSNRRLCSNEPGSNKSLHSPYSNTIPEDSEIVHFRSPLSSSTPVTLRHLGSPEWLRGNASSHSSASSSGSHRSHDSGFLDSVELRRRERGSGRISQGDLHSSKSNSAHVSETTYAQIMHATPTETNDVHLVTSRSRSQSSSSKKSVSPNLCHVINNFESLNKNMRSEKDRNNNSGNTQTPVASRHGSRSKVTSDDNTRPRDTSGDKSRSNSKSSLPTTKLEDRFSTQGDSVQTPLILTDRHSESTEVVRRSKVRLPQEDQCTVTSAQDSIRSSQNEKREQWPKAFLSTGFRTDSGNRSSIEIPAKIKSHFENEAMRHWLYELRFEAEPECLHSLQVKSLRNSAGNFKFQRYDSNRQSRRNGKSESRKPLSRILESIRETQSVTDYISVQISALWKHLEADSFENVSKSILDLVSVVETFLKNGWETHDRNLAELEYNLSAACSQLRMTVASAGRKPARRFSHILENFQLNFDSSNGIKKEVDSYAATMETDNVAEIAERLLHLRRTVDLVSCHRLRHDLSAILDFVGTDRRLSHLALQILATVLYDGGTALCRLAASLRTVRTMLSALIDGRDEMEKVYALRSLATILCIGEAVNDFDKAGGFEIIADILQDDTHGPLLKIEAVAVLTQATDPWIDLDTTLTTLGTHLHRLVFCLSRLIPQCASNEDSFLLTVAAISNLTFLELSSMELLRAFQTISLITSALKRKSDFSVFVLDHVSTIFANMAGIESCREEIVGNGGIELLTEFLHVSPIGRRSAAEITATERLQQKSTIAISRLASEDGVADLFLELGGIHRLVQLSRGERDRNYSDGVLIAALATLRKLVSICGKEVIQELRAEELIQPRLLDSFLLFSSRQESYV